MNDTLNDLRVDKNFEKWIYRMVWLDNLSLENMNEWIKNL